MSLEESLLDLCESRREGLWEALGDLSCLVFAFFMSTSFLIERIVFCTEMPNIFYPCVMSERSLVSRLVTCFLRDAFLVTCLR